MDRTQFSFTDVDVSPERRVLINLITRSEFIREYTHKSFFFETTVSDIVAGWAMDHFIEFQKAPGSYIEHIFLGKKESMQPTVIEEVGRLLNSLSDESGNSEDFDLEFELQQADRFFVKRSMIQLKDATDAALARGDTEKYHSLITGYKKPGRETRKGADFLSDPDEIREAFQDVTPYLFKYPEALGTVIDGIYPGEVTGLMGRTGFGKTWWLLWTAMLATQAGYDTIFVSLEMPKHEIVKRAWQMKLRMGKLHGGSHFTEIANFEEAGVEERPGGDSMFDAPTDSHNLRQDAFYRPVLSSIAVNPINIEDAITAQEDLKLFWQERELKIWAYPTNSLTIQKLRADVNDERTKKNFKPKVVVIDYPRILSKNGQDDYRLRIEQLWIELKQWAGEDQLAVVGGLQVTGDKLSSGRRPSMESIPEAKAINNHVAQLFTLWDAPGDAAQKLMRVSSLKSRYASMTGSDAVVSYSYTIGQPHIHSILSRQLSI